MSRSVKVFAMVVIFGCFTVSVWAGVQAAHNEVAAMAQGGGGSAPTASTQFAILVTTIAGVVSMLATQFFSMYRESRNRKWDLHDRSAARVEMRQHAETQRLETMQTAIELARVSTINRDHLLGAIKENTKITTEGASQAQAAYSAANNFNSKFEALQKQLQEMATLAEKKEG